MQMFFNVISVIGIVVIGGGFVGMVVHLWRTMD